MRLIAQTRDTLGVQNIFITGGCNWDYIKKLMVPISLILKVYFPAKSFLAELVMQNWIKFSGSLRECILHLSRGFVIIPSEQWCFLLQAFLQDIKGKRKIFCLWPKLLAWFN